jgi:hypothetical protein
VHTARPTNSCTLIQGTFPSFPGIPMRGVSERHLWDQTSADIQSIRSWLEGCTGYCADLMSMAPIPPESCTCGSYTSILFQSKTPRQQWSRPEDVVHIPDTSFPLTFNLNCFATVCPPDGVAVVVDERSRSPQRTLRTHWLRRIDGIKVEVDEFCWRLGDMLGLTTW